MTEHYVPGRLWNRFFLLLWAEAFALQMGQNIFNNLISAYAVSLGFSNTLAGSLAIPYMVLAVLGRFLSGRLADTRSRRAGMVLGCAMFTVGAAAYVAPLAAVPAALLLFRGLHGFGYAAASTAYSAAVADVTPPDQLALGLGVNWTAQGAAQLAGGVAVVVLVWGSSYWPAFLCAALFCALGTAAAVLCRYERPAPARPAPPPLRAADILEKSALPHAAVVLIYYMNLAVGTFFTIPLAAERGIEGGGLFFTTCALGMIVSNICLVKLADRFGRLATLLPVFAVSALCDLCLAAAGSLAMLLAAGVLYGISIGAMPVIQSATVEPLPLQRRGAGTATLLLALDSIRRHCGPDFPIEVRISGTDFIEGGITVEEATQLVKMLEGKCDMVNVSAGVHESLELFIRTHPNQYIPKGCNVWLAEEIRKHTTLPISTVGGITDPDMIEEILADGKADIVELARPLLADPYLPLKMRQGREKEIVKCLRCNGCFGESVETGMNSCAVNPIIGNEYNDWIARTQPTTPKKVMVVGGGPAGMQAALTAKERGHEVELYEATDSLGGALKFARHVDFKYGLFDYVQVQEYKLRKAGVPIHLNTPVTRELVEQKAPDVLLIGAGANPIIPRLPGIDSAKVFTAGDSYGQEEKLGDTVVVLGGGMVGCETAAHLARLGKKVTVVEMRDAVAKDADCFGGTAILVDMRKNNVQFMCDTVGKEITAQGLVVTTKDGKEQTLPCDSVINAVGYKSDDSLFLQLFDAAPVVQMIGDCRKPGKVKNASSDGHYVALDI